jgi:hypothetical protein
MSDESCCKFVCSRGLLKSCDVHSPAPRSSCGSDFAYLMSFLENQDAIFERKKAPISIYVCSELIGFFCTNVLDRVKHPFILVSGDSDLTVPHEAIPPNFMEYLMEHPRFVKWYAQNLDIQKVPQQYREKVHHLPIGLDYHTIANNPKHGWRANQDDGGVTPLQQENDLLNIRNRMPALKDRECKIYCNAHLAPDRFYDRQSACNELPRNVMNYTNGFIPRMQTWENNAKHAFVLSPYGNGMDCHRTWEALCLGAIPVVRGHMFDDLYKDLPVLIVDNWRDVNEEVLIKTMQQVADGEFNYDKLTLTYWVSQFQ